MSLPPGPAPGAPAAPRIYVVEDDPGVAQLLLRTLESFQFHAERFSDGRSVLQRLRGVPPDLCIVDLGLPDMDGMDLVRQIGQASSCGVLVLTGRDHPVDRVMALELGSDDYVTKPFDPRELVARVRSILRRCEVPGESGDAARQRVAHFSGWRFDVARLSLYAPDGSERPLSAGEGLMLLRFLERPNRVLPREQLLGQHDISPFDRSIDVRISRLRRKLEDDSYNPRLIKTVYGAGYLFVSSVVWE